MEALIAVINKINDPAVLVLLLVCAGLGFMLYLHTRYDRDDREKLLAALAAIKDAIVESKLAFVKEVSDLKIAIALVVKRD